MLITSQHLLLKRFMQDLKQMVTDFDRCRILIWGRSLDYYVEACCWDGGGERVRREGAGDRGDRECVTVTIAICVQCTEGRLGSTSILYDDCLQLSTQGVSSTYTDSSL
jgi:hypothetical protein